MKASARVLLLTWFGAFVTVAVLLWLLSPLLEGSNLITKALVISGLMVVLMQFVTMPAIGKLMQHWQSSS